MANIPVRVIKYKKDTRYTSDDVIVTHSKMSLSTEENINVASAETLSEVSVDGFNVIAVDEGQFFKDLAEKCDEWANAGKVVIVAALDANFMGEGFGNVMTLLPKSEFVTKLQGVCMICKERLLGAFSKRLGPSTEEIQIGNNYILTCRRCFHGPIMHGANV